MAKTLSESAAEILKASMMNAGKEPAATLGVEMQDLGGQTPEQLPTAIGAAAAAKVAVAPKPGVTGAPAEPIKKAPMAKKVGDEEEALSKNPVDGGTVKAEETSAEGEEVEQINEGPSHFRYTGEVNGKPYEYTVRAHSDLTDNAVHRALKRDNDHLEPHEIKAVVHSGGEEESHVEVEHNGKKYTHHVINEPEPDHLYEEVVAEASPGKTDLPMPLPVKKAEMESEDEDEEDDEEEMKTKLKKEMIEKHRGSMREDVDALFNGESLSEDFRVKATLIF